MKEKPQILIVDDEPSGRDTLEAVLLPEGYELSLASNGQVAMDILEESDTDTILLDVIMPDMDGFEVCSSIKTNKRWQHIPIIMVTGLEGKEDMARGMSAGANDFLQKPVNSLELRARVRSMLRIKRQFDELEDAMRMREDLSNMIVHDMKFPLIAILMTSQLLQMRTNSPQDLKDLGTIQTQTRRLDLLIDNILMLAKMKDDKLVMSHSDVDLNEFIKDVEKEYSMNCLARGINLVTNLAERSHQISIDINLFQRMMDNLLSNAIKFSPSDSTITLCAEYLTSEGDSPGSRQVVARIKIIDEGPGIPEEYRNDVFDRFKVVPLGMTGVKQCGLGLTFCKMVVEAHGGRIFVSPNTPRGSVFTVEI